MYKKSSIDLSLFAQHSKTIYPKHLPLQLLGRHVSVGVSQHGRCVVVAPLR